MQTAVTIRQDGSKWHRSPVTSYQGPIEAVRNFIPRFERRTFGPGFLPVQPPNQNPLATISPPITGTNAFLDAIVRMPINQGKPEIPVGIVSRTYTLLQHHDLFDEVLRTLQGLEIDPNEVATEAILTEYGERMQLSILFPERFSLKLGNDDTMGLRLECFNSVEGSMKFMAVIGWLRFVCSNGLIVGVADTYYRRRHNRQMELEEIAAVLKSGIAATTREKEVYLSWMKKKITAENLEKWVNGPLAKDWGVKAAARTWHITTRGYDVELADPFEKGAPTEKHVNFGNKVPGAVLPGDNVFAVTQALSWLAKERRDVQEQLEWKQQIPGLVKPLLGRMAA